MSLLTHNSTPAERARGCVFAEKFESPEAVAQNGGDVEGAVTIDHSLYGNETGRVTYPTDSKKFLGLSGSIFMRCRLDSDAGGGRLLASDDTAGTDYELRTYCNGTSLTISIPTVGGILLGVTIFNNVPFGVEFTFVVTWGYAVGVTTRIGYTNGVEVYPAAANAAEVKNPDTEMYLGGWGGSNYFDGEIFECKFFNQVLTAQEALDLHNHTTYTYENECSLHLPMGAAQHDPTNLRTLDVSGNARHATFGDGSTPTTYPTKIARHHGYDFDGGDWLYITKDDISEGNAVTFAVQFTPQWSAEDTENSYWYCSKLGNGGTGYFYLYHRITDGLLRAVVGNMLLDCTLASYRYVWQRGAPNLIVVSANGTEPASNQIWLNGTLLPNTNSTAVWSAVVCDDLRIGQYITSLSIPYKNGSIENLRIWPKALTPLQIHDLTIKALGRVNDV